MYLLKKKIPHLDVSDIPVFLVTIFRCKKKTVADTIFLIDVEVKDLSGLCCLTPLSTVFQLYRGITICQR